MKNYINKIFVQEIFDNLKRDKHVMIVLLNDGGNFLLGQKPEFYPKGIVRFIGGGVESGESFEQAATREVKEELQLDVSRKRLRFLAEIRTIGVKKDIEKENITQLFLLRLRDGDKIIPSDDIVGLEEMSFENMHELIERYENLPGDLWFEGGNGESRHSWQDYGRMYAFIHKVVLDLV